MLIDLPAPVKHSNDRHALLDGDPRELTSRIDARDDLPWIAKARNGYIGGREALWHLIRNVLEVPPPVQARVNWPDGRTNASAQNAKGPIVWSEPCPDHANCVVVETGDGWRGDVPTSAMLIEAVPE